MRRDDKIVINYNRLDDKYKDITDEEKKTFQQELTNNVNKLESTLSRIAAPNMKAMSKYVQFFFLIFDYFTRLLSSYRQKYS